VKKLWIRIKELENSHLSRLVNLAIQYWKYNIDSIVAFFVQQFNISDLIIYYMGTDYTSAEAVGVYVDPSIFGWNCGTGGYVFIPNTLLPGYAYWMYAYQPCTLKRTV